MKKRIYLDTSVYGGYFDTEFSRDTIPLFLSIFNNDFKIIISDLLEAEISDAPPSVIKLLNEINPSTIERFNLTTEAEALANLYIQNNVVGKTSIADCQHIAIATIANSNCLVSWNFKHIVNFNRIRGYNSVNHLKGYKSLEILTPKELMRYGK